MNCYSVAFFSIIGIFQGCVSYQNSLDPSDLKKLEKRDDKGFFFGSYNRQFMQLISPYYTFYVKGPDGKAIGLKVHLSERDEKILFVHDLVPGVYTLYGATLDRHQMRDYNLSFEIKPKSMTYIGYWVFSRGVAGYVAGGTFINSESDLISDRKLLSEKYPELAVYQVVGDEEKKPVKNVKGSSAR